ncbi:MAG: hypothetical protein HOP17_10530 [Acidobacteria bacterium]|nr:hypothetical protein [Acidobacteriota bacterium]
MRNELTIALAANQAAFGIELNAESVGRLADYYQLLIDHNALLHLVAPCPPEEFATRHILESLTLLKHLPGHAKFVDVGSGGGLPAIPCLIVREDLKARLIESKEKKAAFLRTAIENLGLTGRGDVVAKQFSETDAGDAEFVVCRALDKFPERLPRLVKWSGKRGLLLFGGEQIGKLLAEFEVPADRELMPLSERRCLFIVKG